MDTSGIRRVFELGAQLNDPINLSIGQPDFPVPDAIKAAAIKAIQNDHNGYTLSQGIPALRRRCAEQLHAELGWPESIAAPGKTEGGGIGLMITSGTSGALYLMNMALLSPGDEIIIPDPYFVAYPSMAKLAQGRAVRCDTYPDFRMTAERIEPLITERTKAVLLNSPANPTGVVLSQEECTQILELCRSRGVLLVSDEIYSEFTFADAATDSPVGPRAPSPASVADSHEDILLIRGFGKSFGCTGWRMGFAAGPEAIIREMTKIQQYSYVCAPAPLQHGCIEAYDVDITALVDNYRVRRDMVLDVLGKVTEVFEPGGAFYCFVKVPEKLGITSQEFFERALERNVLVIPGNVFSAKDTHFRISMAVPEDRLRKGVEILAELLSA
jgi:aspartate/methionine/tyrosine aminotransferase